MKSTTNYFTFALLRWICVWVVISGLLSLLTLNAAAQEPTDVPTPTPMPTWTPQPSPTLMPPPNPSASPTPNNPGATPTGRLVDFRVDDDEIDKGDCVQFSWVVRGDIDRVEFDNADDSKDPILVSALDNRQECPDEDTKFELIVRWLDGTKTSGEIDIEVHSGSSSSGSISDANSSGNGGAGEFAKVTPILMTTSTPTPIVAVASVDPIDTTYQQLAFASTSDSPSAKPAGLLGTVNTLPETGLAPPKSTPAIDGVGEAQPQQLFWLAIAGGVIIFLAGAKFNLVLLRKFLRQSS